MGLTGRQYLQGATVRCPFANASVFSPAPLMQRTAASSYPQEKPPEEPPEEEPHEPARLLSMPEQEKTENSFVVSLLPQAGHSTSSFSEVKTSLSNSLPHLLHLNSKIGMSTP